MTYTLRIYRKVKGKFVFDSGEIHPGFVEVGTAACNYAGAYGGDFHHQDVEQLLQQWDYQTDGPFVWEDDYLKLKILPYLAKYAWNDDNQCLVIPFRRSA